MATIIFRVFLFVFSLFFTGLGFAQNEEAYVTGKVVEGPYKTTVVNGGELSFLATGDAAFPLSLVLDVIKEDGVRVRSLVDKYDVAGSEPKVESVFFHSIKKRKNVFVLVSWELSSRGVGTYGTLYQVYAYEKSPVGVLVVNRVISLDGALSGIDGYQEGEAQSFAYKDASSIKEYVSKYE